MSGNSRDAVGNGTHVAVPAELDKITIAVLFGNQAFNYEVIDPERIVGPGTEEYIAARLKAAEKWMREFILMNPDPSKWSDRATIDVAPAPGDEDYYAKLAEYRNRFMEAKRKAR